jgi:hypothetical protein
MTRTAPESRSSDVLPAWANQILGLLWVLLFGGRWIVVPMLWWNGFMTPEQIAVLDENVLLRVYLVLFTVTILVVALRLVRRERVAPSSERASSDAPQTQSSSNRSRTSRRAEPRD